MRIAELAIQMFQKQWEFQFDALEIKVEMT